MITKYLLLSLSLMFLLLACVEVASTPVPTVEIGQVTATAVAPTTTATPTTPPPTSTATLAPTATATATPSPTATLAPTETPTPSPTVLVWAGVGTAVPQPSAVISPDNATQLTELARWGRGVINDVAYSADGRWLAVATSIGLYIHNAQNLDEPPQTIQEGQPVNRVLFSPESDLLVSLSPRQHAYIWQTADWSFGKPISRDVENIVFSPDGNYLALILPSYQSTIRLWNLQEQKEIEVYHNATAIAFSSDQATYALAFGLGRSTYISLYQLADNRLVNTIQMGSCNDCLMEEVASLAFAANGQVLLVGKGTEYGTYNDTGELEARLVDTGEVIFTMPRAKNHEYLTWVCDSLFFTFEPLHPPSPGRMIVSPKEETFAVIYTDVGWTFVILYGLLDRAVLKIFPEGTNSLAFSSDGSTIITGSTDGKVQLWQSADLSLVTDVGEYDSPITGMTFAPNGEELAIEHLNSVRLRRMADGVMLEEFTTAVKAAYSPDGRQLALGYKDGRIEVWNRGDGTMSYQLATDDDPITQLLFTPDGQNLLSADQNCGMSIWQAADGTFLRPLQDFVSATEVTGDSRIRLASTVISADSQYFIGSFDAISKFGVWQIDSGSLISIFPTETNASLRDLRLVPGSDQFVARGGSQSYIAFSFWMIGKGQPSAEWNRENTSNYYFADIAVSPDGRLLAASSNQGIAEIRQISDGVQLGQLEIAGRFDMSIAFSPDGRFLATGSSDGTVRLWGIP